MAVAAEGRWAGKLLLAPSEAMPSQFPNYLACAADAAACGARYDADADALRRQPGGRGVASVPLSALIMSSVHHLDRKPHKPECLTCSNHFHSICATHPDRRICGRVADAAAQAAWNALYGPRDDALAAARAPLLGQPGGAAELTLMADVARERALVCFDCPKDLMPIHITKSPDPVCYWSPLRHVHGDVGPSYPAPRCPCSQQPVLRSFTTHGGSAVDVRECSPGADAAAGGGGTGHVEADDSGA